MYPKLTAEEVKAMLEKGERVKLVDVREQEEWEEGHIPQARHIPMGEIPARLQELEDDEGPIVFVCRSGARSARVCDYLHERGYSVVNMTGGMLAWDGEVVGGR